MGYGGSPVHVLAESWLGEPLVASKKSLRAFVLRYMAAFCPATVRDIQAWSGLVRVKDQIQELKPELRSFQDEIGNELLGLPNTSLPPAYAPAPVRFVPDYDNLMLSHVDRACSPTSTAGRCFCPPPGSGRRFSSSMAS